MSLSAIGYFDGACLPRNPGGTATHGWAIFANDGGKPGELLAQGHGVVCRGPGATNNRGEYGGLAAVLKAAVDLGVQELIVRGDSELIINQMLGRYKVKAEKLIRPYELAVDLASQIRSVRFQWIPREQNKVADRLSEIAYEELTGKAVNPEKPSSRPGQGSTAGSAGRSTPAPARGGASLPAAGGWRGMEATDKQVHFLRQLGHNAADPLTRGQASELIDRLMKEKAEGV